MNTIFFVKIDNSDPITWGNIEVEGTGQEAASAILKRYKNKTIILRGFHNPKTNQFTPINFK